MNYQLTLIPYRPPFFCATAIATGLLATGLLGAVAAESSNAGPQPLSLDEAVGVALESHPALRAARGRIDAASGRAAQAGLWPNPELELAVEEWPVSGDSGFSESKQTVGLVQTLPFPGKKSLDRRFSRAALTAEEAALGVQRALLIREVKKSYYQVLASERIVAVGQEMVKVSDAFATAARQRVEAGAMAFQEQLRAEIQLEQAQAQLRSFQREEATARELLATLLGRPDLTKTRLGGALVEMPDQNLMQATREGWLVLHPSMVAAQASLQNAQLAERRTRLEPYPDLTLGVAGGRMGDTDEAIFEFRLSLPLPIVDRAKGRKQEASAHARVAQAELDAVRQELQRQWFLVSGRYQVALEEVARYRNRILPKANQALQLVQRGFEEGKFNFMDLLDTQRTTAESRLVYQQKLLEMNIAQAELEALLTP